MDHYGRVIRNRRIVTFLLSAAGPVTIGVYINIYTGIVSNNGNKLALLPTIYACGWWNALILVFGGILWTQYWIAASPEFEFEKIRARLIHRVLEAACHSLVYPQSLDEIPLRAIVSLIDTKKNKRFAKYSFNAQSDPERQGEWPIDFGVTGEAITGKQVVLRELVPWHHMTYSVAIKRTIQDDLRTVLAAPILNPVHQRGQPLGVLAFDSVLTIRELGFESREIRNVAQAWADILSVLITRQDIKEEVD
jgi:hypothetical protein